MSSDEQLVRSAVKGATAPSEADEGLYAAEMGADYAPIDASQPQWGENDIGFNFYMYPTLHKMALDEARVKFCIGPAGCLPAETEVLTRDGWVSIAEQVGEIMVYDPKTGESRFEEAEPVMYTCPEGFHRFYNSHTLDMVVSDEHKVWYRTATKPDSWAVTTGAQLAEGHKKNHKRWAAVPTVYKYAGGSEYPLTDDQLRLMVAALTHGRRPLGQKEMRVTVLRKERRDRMRELLGRAGVEYSEVRARDNLGKYIFEFIAPDPMLDMSPLFGASARQMAVIAQESEHWQTTTNARGRHYTTTSKVNADLVQHAYVSQGISAHIRSITPARKYASKRYMVVVKKTDKSQYVNTRYAHYKKVQSTDGKKYCYITSTGMFVVRHNDRVYCTGNSGKTSGIIWMLLLQAIMQEPAPDGVRYSRAVVARNTNSMLRSTTIPSFKTMVGNLMTFRTGSFPMMAHARFELNDGTRVHFDVEFLSFDDEKSQNKLLGCEPTFGFIDELSEFPESLVFAIDRRLGRYPSGRFGKASWVGLLGATNGPLKNHWLYSWYLGDKDKKFSEMSEQMNRPYFKLFRQPPALLRQPDGTWHANPMAENIENLPGGYNYYYAQLGAEEQKIKAYVEGEFADLVTGKVVFPEFNEARHVIESFTPPGGAPLYLSFDFGRTPVTLVGTMTAGGRLIIIDEVMGEDMSIETLVVEHVRPVLRSRYNSNLVEGAWGDPAGLVQAQSVDVSPYDVLLSHGIPVESPGTNKMQPRIEAVKQRLTKLDGTGQPLLQITKNCKFLIEALKYNYIYESVRGKNDVVRDTPTKSHQGWTSDLADALQYMVLGVNMMSRFSRNNRPRSSRRHTRYI